ncbi:MAG: hypothetical protein DRP68_06360, partial [Candidatus Omnitrophota bacterium]
NSKFNTSLSWKDILFSDVFDYAREENIVEVLTKARDFEGNYSLSDLERYFERNYFIDIRLEDEKLEFDNPSDRFILLLLAEDFRHLQTPQEVNEALKEFKKNDFEVYKDLTVWLKINTQESQKKISLDLPDSYRIPVLIVTEGENDFTSQGFAWKIIFTNGSFYDWNISSLIQFSDDISYDAQATFEISSDIQDLKLTVINNEGVVEFEKDFGRIIKEESLNGWEYFDKGWEYWRKADQAINSGDSDSFQNYLKEAQGYFEKAVQVNPNFTSAYEGIGSTSFLLWIFNGEDKSLLDESIQAYQKAFQLIPEQNHAYRARIQKQIDFVSQGLNGEEIPQDIALSSFFNSYNWYSLSIPLTEDSHTLRFTSNSSGSVYVKFVDLSATSVNIDLSNEVEKVGGVESLVLVTPFFLKDVTSFYNEENNTLTLNESLNSDTYLLHIQGKNNKTDKKFFLPFDILNNLIPTASAKEISFAQVYISDGKLFVEGKEYKIKGVTFSPVGKGEKREELVLNLASSGGEETIKMMADNGINTVRTYYPPEKDLLDAFAEYSIKVIVGFPWNDDRFNPGPDISRGGYKGYIEKYKSHPAILMWELGNEYNFWFRKHSEDLSLDTWWKELKKATEEIKRIDSNHPVSTTLADMHLEVDIPKVEEAGVDVIGLNCYRGDDYSSAVEEVKALTDLPMYFSEGGADSYDVRENRENQTMQAQAVMNIWNSIKDTSALGITFMSWQDEWWKADNPSGHDIGGISISSAYDYYGNEEWWGWVTVDKEPKVVLSEMGRVWGRKEVVTPSPEVSPTPTRGPPSEATPTPESLPIPTPEVTSSGNITNKTTTIPLTPSEVGPILDDKIIVIDKETKIKCYVDEKNLLDAKGFGIWGWDDREVITSQGDSKWVDEDNLIFYISKEFAQILKDKKKLRANKEFNIDFLDCWPFRGRDDVAVFVEGEDGKYYYIDSGKLDQEYISTLDLTKPLPDPEPAPFKIAQKIDIEKAEEWISHQKGKAGLYRSHPQDEAIKNWGFTYDQTLVAIELIKEGKQREARELLDRILDLAKHPTGLFYTAYDVNTGDIREYKVHIGPNVWIAWALAHYIEKYDDRDEVYLKEIENIANNILKFQKTNFGIRKGPGLEGVSTEHMLDSYALFDYLAKKTGNESYIEKRDGTWTWLYIFGYDKDGERFYRGEEDSTIATDVHSWPAVMSFLPEEINKTALINFAEEHCKVTVNFTREDGQVVNVTGFAFKDNQDMISVEWTAQMIVAYLENGQPEKAKFYLTELAKLQSVKGGLRYATQFSTPTGHGWNTPSEGNSLSSTIYAKWAQEGFNPWNITIEKPFEIPEPTLLGPSIYSPEVERWLSIGERKHTYPLVIEDKPLEFPQGLSEPSITLVSSSYSTTGIFNFTIDALDSRAKYAVVEFTNIKTGHSQYLVIPLKNEKAKFDTIPGFFTLTNGKYEVKVTTYLGNPQFRVVPNPEGEGIIWNMRSPESKSCEIEVNL